MYPGQGKTVLLGPLKKHYLINHWKHLQDAMVKFFYSVTLHPKSKSWIMDHTGSWILNIKAICLISTFAQTGQAMH
mgnify:CR=1 FL=1